MASGRVLERGRVRVGVEHEYIVSRGKCAVDFRSIIHSLPIGGRRLDSVDPNAYRLDDGAVVTCDGNEAEVATPPIPIGPGFVGATRDWAGRAAGHLVRSIEGAGLDLEGASTHISIS